MRGRVYRCKLYTENNIISTNLMQKIIADP